MRKDKVDILEKLHKERVDKMSKKGKEFKVECNESERYIREMQEMELKREKKYNRAIIAVVGCFVLLCLVLGVNSIVHMKKISKTEVATKENTEKAIANNKTEDKKEEVKKEEVKKEEVKKEEVKKEEKQEPKIDYAKKVGASLNTEAQRKKIIDYALSINSKKYEGLNVKYMVAILRTNGVNIPANISRTDVLIKELEKFGWKKNTKVSELKKGDIVFTTDTVGISGVPGHSYIFMSWESDKKDNGFVVDALSAKKGVTYYKRSVSVQTDKHEKFQFFMRK
ncbi:hypothetical protein ACER0A_010460 [Haloimpatiens sp. FM7315]|uniref:hypothetical protein n=1 Tax=Haloimpatiens sp. FM7315 TaxID=3298609 RepID=UPI00370B17F8